MTLDRARVQSRLKEFDFRSLFIEELGWDTHAGSLHVSVDDGKFTLEMLAEKRGMVAFRCGPDENGGIPPYATRRKIERQAQKHAHEHIIIYVDQSQTRQIWQWVKKEAGRPSACREHSYDTTQTGEALIQKLEGIAFSLEEEEELGLPDVTTRVRASFDVERVTKRFYDRFKQEHAKFLKFLKGIPDEELERWYVSVMMSRLMFIYFIQKKGFLNGDPNYLQTGLAESQERGKDKYYREFLCPLFFQGFARQESERSKAGRKLLGQVPYLNGGIFQPHEVEQLHGKTIQIPDEAFQALFGFFEQYHWHLDERPLRRDDEINPDVLGYIFEKYINQKQMGAYYSKEDITGYIGQNTVIPRLFDMARGKCRIAFECGAGASPENPTVWGLLRDNPDRYIYPAVRHGSEHPLPEHIACGVKDVSKRGQWNTPAPSEFALPTEIWREVVARRQRYEEVRARLASGEVREINDLITLNLDIRQFAQDVIENAEGPELVRAFWRAINKITVLDPACGSGAFLFAALNILEPLYEACLDRMQSFVDELERSGKKHDPKKYADFREVLRRTAEHPNEPYFIFKSIILNNLYGVDIMEEAVEICKLRLFLKLVAQIERVEDLEPLPDIDFNIRAGNTLVGFASLDEVKKTQADKLGFAAKEIARIEEEAEITDRAFRQFRRQQAELGGTVTAEDKRNLAQRLGKLAGELDRYLAGEYGIDPDRHKNAYAKWRASHKPFHWFAELYGILKAGGFDVVIGNPPYVEYTKVRKEYTIRGYTTEECGNLYAFMSERSLNLLNLQGSFGFIVPIALVCTQRMRTLQEFIASRSHSVWFSNYAERPSKLFVGAEVLLTIVLARVAGQGERSSFSTGFTKWAAEERPMLFERIGYSHTLTKPKAYVLPKISSSIEASLLGKLYNADGVLRDDLQKTSRYPIYYRIGGGRYWKIFTNFQPRFVLNGKQAVSSRENYLYLITPAARDTTISVLSSSLFYWYFILTTNCRDLNPSDLNEFPINLGNFQQDLRERSTRLCGQLMKDYMDKSKLKEKTSRLTGDIVYQEFYPRLSKGVLDEIDRILAQHYGFTDEELDFIINYDIKYRMGIRTE